MNRLFWIVYFILIVHISHAQQTLNYSPLDEYAVKVYPQGKTLENGMLDVNGKLVLPMKYVQIRSIGNGYYAVAEKNFYESFFVVKQNGEKVNNDLYTGYPSFSNNNYLVLTQKGKGSGVVDKNFKTIIPFEFNSLFLTKDDYVGFQKKPSGLFGVMDLNNKIVLNESYRELSYAGNGMFSYKKTDWKGLIDIKGNSILVDTFKSISYFQDGYAIVEEKTKNKKNLFSIAGKFYFPEYKEQIYLSNTKDVFIIAEYDTTYKPKNLIYYLYNTNKKQIISRKYTSLITNGKYAYDYRYMKDKITSDAGILFDGGKEISIASTDKIGRVSYESDSYTITRYGKIGLINKNGILIEPSHSRFAGFKDGAYYVFGNDSTSFIYNAQGKLLKTIDRKVNEVWFNAKNEIHVIYGEQVFMANLKSNRTKSLPYLMNEGFNDAGFALVSTGSEKKLLTTEGKIISGVSWHKVGSLGNGYFFHLPSDYANHIDIYDYNLKYKGALPTNVSVVSGFTNGYCVGKNNNGVVNYYAPNGIAKSIGNLSIVDATSFEGGRAFIKTKSSKNLLFIDTARNIINTAITVIGVSNIRQGKALVKDSATQKFGLIDANGTTLIRPKYDNAQIGDNNIIIWKINGQYGYDKIDGTTLVAGNMYDSVYNFEKGFGPVMKKGKMGFVNSKGVLIIPCLYENSPVYISDNYVSIKQGGKSMVFDNTGKKIIETDYTTIGAFYEGYATVRKGDIYGIIDTKGKLIIPLKCSLISNVKNGAVLGQYYPEMEKIKL